MVFLMSQSGRPPPCLRSATKFNQATISPHQGPLKCCSATTKSFSTSAFVPPDDSGQVRATLAKRDQVWDDDNVGMFLDTFNDHRRYALFFNPLGVQADGIMQEGSGEDYSIDLVMESKGVVTNEGYTVEIAIPFKSLRYEAGKDKLWGAHFFRRIKRFNNELDSMDASFARYLRVYQSDW